MKSTYEEVTGTIIGPIMRPYQFFSLPAHALLYGMDKGKVTRIAAGHFENDEQAAAWFKEKYPVEFKRGVEMRVFD